MRGKKVILREKRLEDALQDYTWRTDKELARLDATAPLKTRFTDFQAFYAEELVYPTPRRFKYAVEDLSGKHIGNCMYYDLDKIKKQVEMGIMIGDRAYWSQGYGTDVVMTFLEYLFNVQGMRRIYLHTLDWNKRAQRCFEKCGFVCCDRVKRDGNTFVVMELLRESWEMSRNPALGESK
ncbi:MAG: GNAT family N-acetyltransferase [Dehalococcoidia bacterium]